MTASSLRAPLIYLLLVAVAISMVVWVAEGATDLPIDALVIAAIVALNGILGFVERFASGRT